MLQTCALARHETITHWLPRHSTGLVNKIQTSYATAQLLMEAGKGHWCRVREESVEVKGKGVLQTYWIVPNAAVPSENCETKQGVQFALAQKEDRLVNWMTQLLLEHMKQVVARRKALDLQDATSDNDLFFQPSRDHTSLEEVRKFIRLPKFDSKIARMEEKVYSREVLIDDVVVDQLHGFVAAIASMYRDNPFHNFEHAAHVTMA